MKEKVADFFLKTFGVREDFWKDLNLIQRGKIVWVNSFLSVDNFQQKIISLGIPLVRIIKEDIFKPTSWGLIFLDKEIRKNRIELDKIGLKEFLERGRIKLNQVKKECENGFAAVSFEGKIIGCGVLKDNILYQKLPKARRKELIEILNKGY